MQMKRSKQCKYGQVKRLLIFFVFYMAGFLYIENRNVNPHIIHTGLDDRIPFCAYFVIPYLLWFLFVMLTVAHFSFCKKDRTEYYQLERTLCAGAVTFLAVSLAYPNGHELRPELSGNGICEKLVWLIYKLDTPTNILPSLHVYYSVACCIAILKTKFGTQGKGVKFATVILTVLIILSTMFLKQHSVMDVVMALFLNIVFYCLFYQSVPHKIKKWETYWRGIRQKVQRIFGEKEEISC